MATAPIWAWMHGRFRPLPRAPRCQWCGAPFAGPLAVLFRAVGMGPFPKNPRFCGGCFGNFDRRRGGAEIPCSALFADVRGSTPLAERLGPAALHDVMDRFYRAGVDALVQGGALVDRFLGDEVVGYFVPGFAGPRHARAAIDSALALLRATGNLAGETPWIPVGAGVHTGTAFVGNLSAGTELATFTALGEDVNVAARLAAQAGAGEVVVSEAAYAAAGLNAGAERRELRLKGVSEPVAVRVLRPPP